MSGSHGSIPSRGGRSRRYPHPATGSRYGNGSDRGGTDPSQNAVVDRGKRTPNHYWMTATRSSTNPDSNATSNCFQVPLLNHAKPNMPYLASPRHASLCSSSSWDIRDERGFHQREQAESPFGGMDLTSEGTRAYATGAATSPTTGWDGQLTTQNFMQDRVVEPYQSRFHTLTPFNSDPFGGFQFGIYDMAQPHQSMPGARSGSSMDLDDRCVDPTQLQPFNGPESQIQTEPWSIVNPRHGDPSYISDQQSSGLFMHAALSTPMSTSSWSEDWSSVSQENPDTSETTFNSDIEDIMNSYPTVREAESHRRPVRQAAHQQNHIRRQVLSNAVAFQCRLQRVATPNGVAKRRIDSHGDNSVVYLSPGDPCLVGSSESRNRDPSSPSSGSSWMSITSSSEPTTLYCNFSDCRGVFRGQYRRGNLARHVRRQHNGNPDDYLCQGRNCPRSFNRSDSRLKHYRRHHPELAATPPVPRGPQGRRPSAYS